MSYKVKCSSVFLFVALALFAACKKDKPKTVPEVTTNTPTDLTATSAMLHGEVIADGNAAITERGFVYSNLVDVPTISDNKLTATSEDAVFSTSLAGLTGSTTYHVRAYAKNSVGVGYGDVINIATENAAPTAINVSATGTVGVGLVLTASYAYQDTENDAESGTTFQWYVADANSGTNEVAINGATALAFTVQAAQFGKFIRVGVTPKAATGTTTGVEVKSAFRDAEPTSVTFTYNGNQVTYGVIVSPTTNKRWLDRNLGAGSVASSVDDFANYGDLFQWGRKEDGHQLITRSGPDASQFTGSSTTSTTAPFEYSDTDIPSHSKFFIEDPNEPPFDWRKPSNQELWQGVSGTNNPCPTGFKVPTQEEFAAEGITSITDGFAKLKLPKTGRRFGSDGLFYGTAAGTYSTSTHCDVENGDQKGAVRIIMDASTYNAQDNTRGNGQAVRCIKN
jgi:hypothetical protein